MLNHSLDPVRTDDFKIGQVADNLNRGPFVGNGASDKLLLGHASHSLP